MAGMSGHKVLFTREDFAGLPWTELEPLLPGWEISACPAGELAGRLDGVDVVCPVGAWIGADMVAQGRFGLIQQYGVGLDKIDVGAATGARIWVCRLPGDQTGNADSVAELAVLLVLAAMRRLDEVRAALREGRWGRPVGRSLAGTTTALVGLGAIGTAVAGRLAGFGTRMIGVRASPGRGGPASVQRVVGPDRLHEVLAEADVIVCSAMGGAGTRHLFDQQAFAACRPGAVFVNVARGTLVDEPALLAPLDSGTIAAAGLDVHAVEPADPWGPLPAHPRVIATPHVAGVTESMFRRSGELFAANLTRWARGERPQWAVNEPRGARSLPASVRG
jgi:phosphoglycerate dehydrogenase-like enzyme